MENTFYRRRTHSVEREHILYTAHSTENTFYRGRTHSIEREHILYRENKFCIERTHSIHRAHSMENTPHRHFCRDPTQGVTVVEKSRLSRQNPTATEFRAPHPPPHPPTPHHLPPHLPGVCHPPPTVTPPPPPPPPALLPHLLYPLLPGVIYKNKILKHTKTKFSHGSSIVCLCS